MTTSHSEARNLLQQAFHRRREATQGLAARLRAAIDSADNAAIRQAFHQLSAAIEGRIVWEQGTVVPLLSEDQDAGESGCVAHVQNDHLVLLRLLDAFGSWLIEQPLVLEGKAQEVGKRHLERLWSMLSFHERREADFTYPALASFLATSQVAALARALESGMPFCGDLADAA